MGKILSVIIQHLKTAWISFYRHLSMCFSAAFSVSITLILIALFSIVVGNMNAFTQRVETTLKIYATIDSLASEEDIAKLKEEIEEIDGVKRVTFSSKEEELDILIEENGSVFERYKEANPMKNTYIIEVENAVQIESICEALNALENIDQAQYGGASIQNMIEIFEVVQNAGMVFIALFLLIAVLLITNTIKMTIYSRNVEISIMRSVGATNGYIRTPFMIEGMYIGIIGSLIPIIMTVFGYRFLYETMNGQFLSDMFVLKETFPFVAEISAILLLCGVGVGIFGSFLAVNKYLRWQR